MVLEAKERCAGCRVDDADEGMVPIGATIAAMLGMMVARRENLAPCDWTGRHVWSPIP